VIRRWGESEIGRQGDGETFNFRFQIANFKLKFSCVPSTRMECGMLNAEFGVDDKIVTEGIRRL
jgi:hypothetical protein